MSYLKCAVQSVVHTVFFDSEIPTIDKALTVIE
jgi:hypothetical protein